ncbi:MAG: sigma-54 dependent transcriptional regulator [Thermodesulfobacteriota bacterium]
MDHESPWTSCFLTRMIILHLEKTGKDTDVDYSGILESVAPSAAIEDPKTFLKDHNNWIPHHVLKKLVRAAERATGRKDVAYLAARDYFEPGRAPSLLEVIVKLLNDIEQILLYSNLWAGGYGNYLKLQCLTPSATPSPDANEVVLLSRFAPSVVPSISGTQMVRGNYEGFTGMFDYVEDAACVEQLSQIKIETVVGEFEGYRVEEDGDRLSIVESASDKAVATARKIYLKTETLPFSPDCPVSPEDPEEMVVRSEGGAVSVLTARAGTSPHDRKEENAAYEIVRGGTLKNGPLEYTLGKGRIFNAPYSRYLYKWKAMEVPKAHPEVARTRREIVPLLFNHLRGVREARRMQLVSAMEKRALARENENLKTGIQRESDFFGIVGKSEVMQELFERTRMVAQVDSTVLITGETGTGKELLARAVHLAGPRRDMKFLAINCTALPESILEAELFGYEKGAFTGALSRKQGIFEAADGGTLFMDEVGDISPAMQARLLRVLEEREIQRVGGREPVPVDVRVVSATNKDLKELVSTEKFRSDLYYRLHVITLDLPPLRERTEDLLLLVDHYLEIFSRNFKKEKPAITADALAVLRNCPWPGNIRELKNVIEHAVVMDRDGRINPEDITLLECGAPLRTETAEALKPFHDAVESHKRHVIEQTLKKTGGNQTRAAELLGLQRTYLSRLIRQLGITPKDRTP